MVVSIHAPARGATRRRVEIFYPQLVSIHAPARGATASTKRNWQGWKRFNSRAREGRDMRALKDAPRDMLFQFTRPRGARLAEIKDAMGGFEFQFTRPRGARRRRVDHRGRDADVSIHAPARGATACHGQGRIVVLFQFTRPRGARLLITENIHHQRFCFNSRAREGRDPRGGISACRCCQFQFTRPRGARRASPRRLCCPCTGFNSRAREGRDKRKTWTIPSRRMFQFTRPRGARPLCNLISSIA